MSSELRRSPRVSGYAKAVLLGPAAVPGWVRDLSRTGCQVAFMQPVPAAVGEVITLRVIAEHDASLPAFELRLRVRWVRPDSIWQAIGGEVEPQGGQEGERAFQALVEYYAGGGGPTSGPSPRSA